MSPKDADGMANSADPDQTAPLGAVWSRSTLFAQAYLSENLGSLWYFHFIRAMPWENLFMPYANKGADQPAHPCSLISTFNVRCLRSIISLK